MKDLLRSEWFKLRTVRLNIWLPALAVAGLLLVTSLVTLLTPDAEILDATDLASVIGGFSILVSMMIGITTSLGITSEFNHHTIRPTLAATPRRQRVFAAKAIVSAGFGLLVGTFGVVASYGLGATLLSSRGGAVGLSTDDGTISALGGVIVLSVLLALFGYGVGLLVRNGPAAVSLVVLWPLLIESIIGGVLSVARVEEPQKFLPYTSAFALVTPEDSDPGRIYGGVFFALVAIALVVLGSVVNNRRDV